MARAHVRAKGYFSSSCVTHFLRVAALRVGWPLHGHDAMRHRHIGHTKSKFHHHTTSYHPSPTLKPSVGRLIASTTELVPSYVVPVAPTMRPCTSTCISLIIMASRLIYSRAFTSLPATRGMKRPPSFSSQLLSSHFRDADSSSSYDALKDELASGEFSDSGDETSAAASLMSAPDVDGLLNKAVGRAFSTLDAASTAKGGDDADAMIEKQAAKKHVDKRTYLSNPNVTPTALAHSLWRETIIPGVDTVIDATCGNGKDSVALSEMLFDQTLMGTKTLARIWYSPNSCASIFNHVLLLIPRRQCVMC